MSGVSNPAPSPPVDPGVCEGRLTLTTGVPVTTADVVAATSIYFTPYKGNRISLYDGAAWVQLAFVETSLALGTLTNDLPYDVFAYDNAGTLALELLAWTSKTARATALVLQDGVLVKTGALTRRYLGTFHTTSTTTTEDSAAKRLLWNYAHRQRRAVTVIETTNSWTYTTDTWRQANGAAANQVAVVIGVAEDPIDLSVAGAAQNATTDTTISTAIGEDSTAVPTTPGQIWQFSNLQVASRPLALSARLVKVPTAGYHFYAWLERSVAQGTTTWFGDNSGDRLQAGIVGSVQG